VDVIDGWHPWQWLERHMFLLLLVKFGSCFLLS